MRKVTREVVSAFLQKRKLTIGNTCTDGRSLFLHMNPIAEHAEGGFTISTCGWATSTTLDRLRGLPGVNVYRAKRILHLNDEPWDGKGKFIPWPNSTPVREDK